MKSWTLWGICCAMIPTPFALAQDPSALAAIRAACTADAQKFCAGVQPGGGRIVACLKDHRDELSDQCKQAAERAASASNQTAPGTAVTSPSTNRSTTPASPEVAAPPATANPPTKSSHTVAATLGASASKDAPRSYLRLKKVQVVGRVNDEALGPGTVEIPVLSMLIPSDWSFEGGLAMNSVEGCYIDVFSVSWDAKSPDGTVDLTAGPNSSWQYADDPAELRKLSDPAQRELGGNGKPCPIGKPLSAEDFFRQKIAARLKSTDTVVAVEPFPELNQIARAQLGLPADQASDRNGIRVDAIRARIDSGKDEHPSEGWVALVLVTHTFQAGRGTFYDCRVIDLLSLRTPKGKLDANDKLFKVMISSLRTEAKWQSYSGKFIANLYRAEAQKHAIHDATIAKLQAYAVQTTMAVTANQMQGSFNGAFAADQNIRGVQTFLDPKTGNKVELSNLYDHAWLNGANEYVMSEDANFNPNGQLNGDWNQLQVVRPAP